MTKLFYIVREMDKYVHRACNYNIPPFAWNHGETKTIIDEANVYKICTSTDKNIKDLHPKDSIFEITVNVNDCQLFMEEVANKFNSKFIKRSDIGKYYYQCNIDDMMNVVRSLDRTYNATQEERTELAYYVNGNLYTEKTYVNNKLNGKCIMYNNDGRIKKECEYVNGIEKIIIEI